MMAPDKSKKFEHFSAFSSASEEVSGQKRRQASDEAARGDHMSATRGRIVRTPAEEKPYKVVLEHEECGDTEHPVSSMQEGEALIKRKTPRPITRDRSRDR